MSLTPDQIRVLDTIREEWDRAEVDIKLAEQVCDDIIVPAVKELRYAGRRLVDLIQRLSVNPGSEDIPKLLADAEFGCHRARHDAIDAATSRIAIQLKIMADKLGYDVLLAVAPEYREIALTVVDVREKIVEARGDNRKDRLKIYAVVSATNFPDLVSKYTRLKLSEPIMIKMAAKGRRRDFYGKWGFWAGLGGFVIGIVALWFFFHPLSSPQLTTRAPAQVPASSAGHL